MNWVILSVGHRRATDVERALPDAAVLTSDDPAAWSPSAGTDGIALVGTDHDLARFGHELAQRHHRIPIALVPTHPSDLLRMFGLGRSDIVARLPDGEPYPIDLGVVTMEGIDFPFVANAVARPGRARPWGGAVAVAVGPRSCTTQAWMVTIANAQHHGRWTVAPRAALMDGAMDVQVFAGSIARRPHIQRLLRHGLHTRSKAVWRSSGTAIDATIPASWRVRTDGVAIGSGPLAARLEPGALTLWI